MKYKCIVIGASNDCIYTINLLKSMNIYTIAIDGDKNAVGLNYANEKVIADITNLSLMEKITKNISPDFIMPVPIGRYLTTVGYLNSILNLKGISHQSTINTTDKLLFHNILKNNNLRNINCYLYSNNLDFNIKYPCILKPRFGSGCRDIFYLKNSEDLYKSYNKIKHKNEDFIIEEMFKGEEYGLDGAFINGTLHIALLRKKIMTKLPFFQSTGSISQTLDYNLKLKITDFFTKALNALNCNNCILQIDLIIDESQNIFPIEISPRPCGHSMYSNFVPITTGLNITKEYINFLTNNKFNFNIYYTKNTIIKFFDFENIIINEVPNFMELKEKYNILDFKCNIKTGDFMCKVTDGHSIINRGYFILEDKNKNSLIEKSSAILNKFKGGNI